MKMIYDFSQHLWYVTVAPPSFLVQNYLMFDAFLLFHCAMNHSQTTADNLIILNKVTLVPMSRFTVQLLVRDNIVICSGESVFVAYVPFNAAVV